MPLHEPLVDRGQDKTAEGYQRSSKAKVGRIEQIVHNLQIRNDSLRTALSELTGLSCRVFGQDREVSLIDCSLLEGNPYSMEHIVYLLDEQEAIVKGVCEEIERLKDL